MFTGIITAVADVVTETRDGENLTLTFSRPAGWDDLAVSESIATNGVCLTVAALRESEYDCVLMTETLRVSSFGQSVPKQVNLERSLKLADRLSGHIVQGHVDAVGTVSNIDKLDGYVLSVQFPSTQQSLIVHKGSITINGVALTITDISDDEFSVALIPHTLKHTTLGSLQVGDFVNLEFDIVGKYIQRIVKS